MPEPDDPLQVLETRALALLARREYTRVELARRLAHVPATARAPGAEDEATAVIAPPLREHVEALLDRLAERGLLSDLRAAEAIVHAHGRQRGLLRVRQELEQRGVPDEVKVQALAGLREQQVPLARAVWRKRFGILPGDAAERARQTRFLAARGFSFEVIRAVLGRVAGTDEAGDDDGA